MVGYSDAQVEAHYRDLWESTHGWDYFYPPEYDEDEYDEEEEEV